MALNLTEEQQKEMLQAQEQARLMGALMETPGATPGSLGSSSVQPPQMDTGLNENKRTTRNEEQEPERRQGKGPKLPRHDSQPSGWGNRRSKDGWGAKWWQDQEKEGESSSSANEVAELCYAMAQMVLRHEDQHNINRIESGFVMFCQTKGMLSMVPDMFKATTIWQQTKAEKPQELTLTLRATLLHRFATVWLQRMQSCLATEESKKQAEEMLILNADGTIPYLQYNKEEMKMEVKKDRDSLGWDEACRMIREIGELALLPLTVLRFHPLRKLVEQYEGDILPMSLQLGLRTPESDRCWQNCSRLAHSGACRVVAMTMRGEKMGRTGLAVHIQEMMNKRSDPYASPILITTATVMLQAVPSCGHALTCS